MFFFIPGHLASRPPQTLFSCGPQFFPFSPFPRIKKIPFKRSPLAPRSNLLQAPGLAGQLSAAGNFD